MIASPDRRTAVRSLDSTVCPACGGRKKRAMTFCGGDYHALPQSVRWALYRPVGRGYEDAVADAMNRLGAAQFILPPEGAPRP